MWIPTREAHRVEPQRTEENNKRAKPALEAEVPDQRALLPFPQKRMPDGKEHRGREDAADEPAASTLVHDDVAAKNHLLDHRRHQRIEAEKNRDRGLLAADPRAISPAVSAARSTSAPLTAMSVTLNGESVAPGNAPLAST